MSHEMVNAQLDREDTGEESSANIPPQVSPGPEETWVPHHIHTAICDRCGERNKSVVQRSSRENKQFCKPCMHQNVSDGLYSVDVEQMDWTSQAISSKGHARVATTFRIRKQPKKPIISPAPTRVSKRKPKERKASASKRSRLAAQPERECRSKNSLFVTDEKLEDEGEETDDNVGLGFLISDNTFSSEGLDEIRDCEGKGKERPTKIAKNMGVSKLKLKLKLKAQPQWKSTQAPTSRARLESPESIEESNLNSITLQQRPSEFDQEAIAAAHILLTFRKIHECRHKLEH